jgi:hypothetical protein
VLRADRLGPWVRHGESGRPLVRGIGVLESNHYRHRTFFLGGSEQAVLRVGFSARMKVK